MNSVEMILSVTGGVACLVAAGGMAVRAHLLGGRVSGWPSAPRPLRVALWTCAGVTAMHGATTIWWASFVGRGECAVYVAMAVLSVFYAVNLIAQRSEEHATPVARPHGLKLVPSRKRH